MTNTVLAALPIAREFDNFGASLGGALVFTYQAGSTTPLPTYQDLPGLVQNSNPIILDSSGRANVRWIAGASYKVVCTDPTGGTVLWSRDNYTPPPSDAASVGVLLFPQTSAESAVGVVPVNYQDIPANRPVGDVARYGCVMDGATDDTAAFALACSLGGKLVISGPMALSSSTLSSLTNGGITLKSGTTIRFTNGGSITVTGTTACNVFYSTNQYNIRLIDPKVTGNGVGSASALGYLWYCKADASASSNLTGYEIRGGIISNFGGNYWVYFDNTAGTTYYFKTIRVTGTQFISLTGNARAPTDIQVTAHVLGFSGSDTVSYYGVRDVKIERCYADGTYIKSFAVAWTGVENFTVCNNTLDNFGTDSSFTNDTGAYAIFAYDHGHGATSTPPDSIDFYGNFISAVRDCGIYIAGANRVSISNNIIRAQTSTADTSLPKGAIALNSPSIATLVGNRIHDSQLGVSVVPNTSSVTTISDTLISNIRASGFGVKIAPTGTGTVGDVIIDGIKISTANASVVGVQVGSNSTIGLSNFALRNFRIATPFIGLYQFSTDSTVPAIGTSHVCNGEFANQANYGINWVNNTNAASRAIFENLAFYSPVAGAVMLDVATSNNVTVRNITFNDMTSGAGFGIKSTSTQGTLSDVYFRNVAVGNRYSTSNDMGVISPGWTGNINDFVQNLNPTELGSAASKYVILGWVYDAANAAWKNCRCLTGN